MRSRRTWAAPAVALLLALATACGGSSSSPSSHSQPDGVPDSSAPATSAAAISSSIASGAVGVKVNRSVRLNVADGTFSEVSVQGGSRSLKGVLSADKVSWQSTDRLQPKVIVEHYTVSSTFSSAWNTFASNAPDVELHERPGVCSHFIVDKDGTIYQLVSLRYICRHTVGLNDRAIGIEHVGYSDAEILGRPKQLRASLRLTRWLQARYGISTKNVIGHSESLSSPYHHERVARLPTQTHGDWTHADMRRYRAKL